MASLTGTLLIDARSAGASLPRELALLAPLTTEQAFEMIVIDDTQDSRVAGITRRHGARHLPMSDAPLGKRLSSTIPVTLGSVLVFPTLGCLTSRTLLELAHRVSSGEVDAVILTGNPPGLLARMLTLGRKKPATAAGICLARQWYERIGGCDPLLDHDALNDLIERLRLCGARLEQFTAHGQAS